MSGGSLGKMGEQIARGFLVEQGFTILETNYRYGKNGEIDIVARDGEYLVFCEVKTRSNDQFGPPENAITPRKQQQVRRVAKAYLFEHEIRNQACRFDVVAIRLQKGAAQIELYRNAF